ncbi:glycerol-3-phosphate responsive antiterminator [Nonomuraea rhodomycinica]|uniref:Glycerol-3-phosphate responsive antiterminator n=1 Tax=Nonomuraea rhodomycinica TaxID=1712872 RepID=A0A7Y6IXY1_9ACTN|nr:glycerol-3-phosphate responsive antiterminator [Nonomuraea rhodomycinica]NUW46071.1 glycerol-3-phosphate responsive antiterminator [Nonomuraea rhodomycinica]
MTPRPKRPLDRRLLASLAEHPVMASLVGAEMADRFTTTSTPLGILASVPLGELEATVRRTLAAGKLVFVNMDSTPGLGHDPGALAYLQGIGAIGICSTRAAIVERASGLGLLTMQKVFVTDRSNLQRSLQGVARSRPDLVQLMPAVVLRYVEQQVRDLGVPYLAAGFVQGAADVVEALRHGAAGVCTSDTALWELRRSALRAS